jgi:hypothetical protein
MIDPVKEPDAFRARFGESETIEAFMEATVPDGAAAADEDFGPGQDTVRYQIRLPRGLDLSNLTVTATMYSQAIPPYWLRQRFSLGAVIALKSMHHFRAAFEPIAGQVVVCDSGALCTLHYERLPYRNVPRPIFPLDQDSV